jgi:hypothetical protein
MTTNADEPATSIRAYPDGPILVRGDFELLDEEGRRCGRSALAPLCDGTHSVLQSRSGA